MWRLVTADNDQVSGATLACDEFGRKVQARAPLDDLSFQNRGSTKLLALLVECGLHCLKLWLARRWVNDNAFDDEGWARHPGGHADQIGIEMMGQLPCQFDPTT